ncbi:uncharacterized protein PFL1_00016 [Pseudozyma flocculosa PF-1]|uniref:DUF7702 domain-containing protein n=1 Tax=Pseudozyma flocculosa TaxID=84751 RepID=A0A5C3EVV1_9BASI|nr:uncharacterized protein PFL1_00016 [Pseudozyma flocculosa PF-1]EPQ31817.1 hypothetical protein PFL1_00016 [Pseudozyma flocculosa PF-1]SPO35289.1 uncharacterized protein PSFLO_00760 [Pseudozyma flocculosa]
MSQPVSVTIDEVFVAIYALLFLLAVAAAFKQGFSRAAGFFSLVLFTGVKLAGNAILIYVYHDNYKNTNMVTTGYILRGLGYSFLVSSVISFLSGVYNADQPPKSKKPFLLRLLHLANIAALVLLIMGYSNSDSVFDGTSTDGKLDSKAPIGDAIFAVITVFAFLFTLFLFPRSSSHHRKILVRVVLALPLMLVRVGFGTYKTAHRDFLKSFTVWQNLGFEWVEEVLAVLLLLSVAFVGKDRDEMRGSGKWEERYPLNYAHSP